MNDDKNVYISGGVGFWEILQIAFIVLKLCGIINWSWWVVFLPTLAGLAIGIIITALVIIWFKSI
jgi:hypothetical protein